MKFIIEKKSSVSCSVWIVFQQIRLIPYECT